MVTRVAWVLAVGSFLTFLVALQVGPSCANSAVGPCAAVFFVSWLWLAYRHDRSGR